MRPNQLTAGRFIIGICSTTLFLGGCSESSEAPSTPSSVGGKASSETAKGGGSQTTHSSAAGGATQANNNSTVGGNVSAGGTSTSSSVTTGGSSAASSAKPTGGSSSTGGASSSRASAAGGRTAMSVPSSAAGSGQTTGGKAAGGAPPAAGGALVNSAGRPQQTAGAANATGGVQITGGSTGGGGRAAAAGSSSTTPTTAGTTGVTSPGCGNTSPLKTGNFNETIDGTKRTWMLDVPANYDASKPYRLIFVWHPLGGTGSQIVSGGYNGLKTLSNNTTVFATADGLNGKNSEASGTGWWNANDGDMKLVQIMLDKINAGLCIDQQRIFSTGFSFGGMMSYTLPFVFDVFRAVAPCSGKTGVIDYKAKYSRPIPIMAFHGDKDTFVATSGGKAFFDMYRNDRNHCGSTTKAVDPSPCVQYDGCDQPSIWCEFPGQHETWSKEPDAIWKFFSQF